MKNLLVLLIALGVSGIVSAGAGASMSFGSYDLMVQASSRSNPILAYNPPGTDSLYIAYYYDEENGVETLGKSKDGITDFTLCGYCPTETTCLNPRGMRVNDHVIVFATTAMAGEYGLYIRAENAAGKAVWPYTWREGAAFAIKHRKGGFPGISGEEDAKTWVTIGDDYVMWPTYPGQTWVEIQ